MRAFDVRTGKQIWRFNTMPGPGEFGHDTWENNPGTGSGNNGRVDADHGGRGGRAGLLPVETPTVDLYGGDRPGDEPVRRKPGGRRSQDRRAQVALPVRPPPAVGSRHVFGAAPGRRDDRRQAPQGRAPSRASRATCMCSIASPASRSGRCRKRRCPRATCRGEKAWPDAADSEQAADVRARLPQEGRPHRLHAGDAGAGAREPEDVSAGSRRRTSRRSCRARRCAAPSTSATRAAARTGRARLTIPELHTVLCAGEQLGVTVGEAHEAIPADSVPTAGQRPLHVPAAAEAAGRKPASSPWSRGRGAAEARRPAGAAPSRPRRTAGGRGARRCRRRRRAAGGSAAADSDVQGLPIVKPPYGVLSAIDLERRNAQVAGAARRDARQHPQPPGAQGPEHPAHGPARQRGPDGYQDAGRRWATARSRRLRAGRAARCSARTTS